MLGQAGAALRQWARKRRNRGPKRLQVGDTVRLYTRRGPQTCVVVRVEWRPSMSEWVLEPLADVLMRALAVSDGTTEDIYCLEDALLDAGWKPPTTSREQRATIALHVNDPSK